MLTRIATINDIEMLRVLYEELEYDAVKYQPEHFVVGYSEDTFFTNIFENSNCG